MCSSKLISLLLQQPKWNSIITNGETSPLEGIENLQNKTRPPLPNPTNEDHLWIRNTLLPIPSRRYKFNQSVSPSVLDDSQHAHFHVSPAQILSLRKILGKRSYMKRKQVDTLILMSTITQRLFKRWHE